MPARRYPVTVSARVTPRERGLIDAAATIRGVTINELIRQLLLPGVAKLLATAAQGTSVCEGASEPVAD